MQYVRSIDFDSAEITGDKGYKGKILYSGERCIVIATEVPPGAKGPGNHVHPMDQLYYIIDGEVKITLGSEVCTAPTGSAVFIPAGVPHHNWNEGAELETHLEVLAPGSVGLQQLAQLTESQDAGGQPYTVVAPGADAVLELDGGMTLTPLVGRDQGSDSALIYLATLPTGAVGPELHIHEFDQFYLVLDGLLGVQIGLEEYTIGPRHIAILPAGVPHRQWNAGEAVERHLTILTPPPEHMPTDDRPWDVSVELRAGTSSQGAA